MHYKSFKRGGHPRRLRNACRAALVSALILVAGAGAGAQSYPNRLAADSVHPSLDSLIIRDMRARMDSIHRTQHRPTVALVLSGGGAKGAAHVGVLKLIEELDIPVDVICGTSMGGLMGGLYALGYSSSFLDSLLRAQDWSVTLTDKIDQKYVPYADKIYKETFLLSIPFHYKNEDFSATRIAEQEKYSAGDGTLHMEAGQGELNTQMGMNTIASSLPSGYVFGFNVNNMLSSLSVGYQDNIQFSELPVPFFCVASDIISCKAKNWGSGRLKTAMRSTMSIPGMFDPVRTHGMILVDGGTRNNFPVDLARSMGADLVIGVDLSDLNPSFSQVNHIGDILSQFITMLGKDAFDRNKPDADVFIKPDLAKYNMLSFDTESISDMIRKGYSAAKEKEDELKELKRYMRGAGLRLGNVPATDINETPVLVSAVIFNGVTDEESLMLHGKAGIKAGSCVSKKMMDEAMSRLLATKAFESVTYSLLGKEEPYRLVFNCVKAPMHRMGIGVRADSEDLVSLLAHVGLNANKLIGSKLDFMAKIGQDQYGNVRYSYDMQGLPTLNAEVRVSYNRNDMVSRSATYNMGYWGHCERFYFSNMKWTVFDLELGLENRYCAMTTAMSSSPDVFNQSVRFPESGYLTAFLKGNLLTMDSRYFPSRGQDFRFSYELNLADTGRSDDFSQSHIAAVDYSRVIPLGTFVSLIPDVHARQIIGGGSETDMFLANYAGGSVAGRWIGQQMPFVGVSEVIPLVRDKFAMTLNLDLRVNPVKNWYFSAKGGYLNSSSDPVGMVKALSDGYWGMAAEVGYNSLLGPLKADIHWSDLTRRAGFYVSAGFEF